MTKLNSGLIPWDDIAVHDQAIAICCTKDNADVIGTVESHVVFGSKVLARR